MRTLTGMAGFGRLGTWRPPLWNAAFVVLAATPFSGCNPPRPPAEVVEPTIVGVVESIAHDTRGRILLVDGTEITWDQVAFEITTRAGSEGDLLIYGTDPIDGGEAPWMIMVPPSVATVGEGSSARPACYRLLANGEVRGDRMALSVGFSLPIADPSDNRWQQGEFIDYPMRDFCLDEAGRVLSRQ
ncbi:MAG TPA: hypothetical protein VHR55_05150 [Candidatus Limnocylindria bacterium]|nr:hypothetical protein [Candidatus Limnocylindria bacterium]